MASQATQLTAQLALRSKTYVTCFAFLPLLFSTGLKAKFGLSISTTKKFGFSIVTTTGFPLLVPFARQLENSNLGAIKVWNLEPQTEKVTHKLRTFEEIFFQNPDLKIEK